MSAVKQAVMGIALLTIGIPMFAQAPKPVHISAAVAKGLETSTTGGCGPMIKAMHMTVVWHAEFTIAPDGTVTDIHELEPKQEGVSRLPSCQS